MNALTLIGPSARSELAEAQRLTIRESLASVKLHLWDEKLQKLLSFAEARRIYGPV